MLLVVHLYVTDFSSLCRTLREHIGYHVSHQILNMVGSWRSVVALYVSKIYECKMIISYIYAFKLVLKIYCEYTKNEYGKIKWIETKNTNRTTTTNVSKITLIENQFSKVKYINNQ